MSHIDLFPPVETARLVLRCVAPGDAEATSALMTPEVSRWVATWPVPFTPEMAARRIAAMRRAAEARDALPFAVVVKTTSELAGWIMLNRHGDGPRRASLGYWLGERHHGRGYMREAAPAAVDAGFRQLGVEVIGAAAQPANEASFAVMRACGMRQVGEAMVHAPTRRRDELCHLYEVARLPRAPSVCGTP